MTWDDIVRENEIILIDWYRRIASSGHGDIHIEISQSAGRIEIRPQPKIRDNKAQKVFESKGGG